MADTLEAEKTRQYQETSGVKDTGREPKAPETKVTRRKTDGAKVTQAQGGQQTRNLKKMFLT